MIYIDLPMMNTVLIFPRLCQISKEYTLGRYQVASNHVPLSSCPFIAGFIPMLAGHRIKPDPYFKKTLHLVGIHGFA